MLEPFLAAAGAQHSRRAARLLQDGDVSHFLQHALAGLERELNLARRFLHTTSLEPVRGCYERACVQAHLGALHADVERLLREAADGDSEARRLDLRRMYALLRPLGANALRPLVDAAHQQVVKDGMALLDEEHPKDEVRLYSLRHIYENNIKSIFRRSSFISTKQTNQFDYFISRRR